MILQAFLTTRMVTHAAIIMTTVVGDAGHGGSDDAEICSIVQRLQTPQLVMRLAHHVAVSVSEFCRGPAMGVLRS